MDKSIFNEVIYLIKTNTNFYGKSFYIKLKGNNIEKCNKSLVLNESDRFRGYYFTFLTWKLRKDNAVIFLYNNKFYLFYNNKYINIEPHNYQIHRFLNYKKVIINKESLNPLIIKVFTSPLHYFSNDGMFPDMVEPFISSLDMIKKNYDEQICFFKALPSKL